MKYIQEMTAPVVYKGKNIDCGFRVDILVEDEVVVELKSIDHILPVHEAQVLTYLRLLGKQVGLLINFKVPILKQGIRRCVLNAYEEEVPEPDWARIIP